MIPMRLLRWGKALALLLTFVLLAPTVLPAVVVAHVNQDTKEVILPDGTEFEVETTEDISSKTAAADDPLSFKVVDDVKVNGQTVIAAGTLVKGVVSNAKKSGMMGKGGQLGIRIESTTTVDGQKIKLRSSKGKEGGDKTGTTVALVVLFGPLGFLKHGKNAQIKKGTRIKVFTDEEKKVQLKA
jgi:hypothetical protein